MNKLKGYIKSMAKRALAALLCGLILIGSIEINTTNVNADSGWIPNASSGASGGATGSGDFTITADQGLRVSLYSGGQLFPLLGSKAVVDFWYDEHPSSDFLPLGNSENRKGVPAYMEVGDIIHGHPELSDMPYPIDGSGGQFVLNGAAVREYLMTGVSNLGFTPSSGTTSGGSGVPSL